MSGVVKKAKRCLLKRVLLTGVSGFIGAALVNVAHEKGFIIRGAVRSTSESIPSFVEQVAVGNILPNTNWQMGLDGSDIVIHLAARVHVMQDMAGNPLSEFRLINTEATLNLARQAAESGVKRFIYLSSIKVNGELTSLGTPFTPDDIFVPTDHYALSKYEAEQGLLSLAKETNMDVVIIRPPLVYGPKVKANFLSMMKWLYNSIPLPFGAIQNKRSLVALDNLIDLIITCIEHPSAANEVFLVSDDEDLSTSELLTRVSNAEGKRAWLLPVNQKVLEFCLGLIGKKDLAQRLCASLQVDISKTKKLLNWTPVISVDEGLKKTTQYFIESNKP
jgi:nucleoside-diphosphate-sugar epimerase